jgi:hypothetical protein
MREANIIAACGYHFDKTDVKMVVTFLRNFFVSSARDTKTECAIWGNQWNVLVSALNSTACAI